MSIRTGETGASADRKLSDKRRAMRAKRTGTQGPIGFNQVLEIAKRQGEGRGATQKGANATSEAAPQPAASLFGFVAEPTSGPAVAGAPTTMSIAAVDARFLDAVSGEASDATTRIELGSATDSALESMDASQLDGAAMTQSADQASLMTPQRALDSIADQAGTMDKMRDESEFVLRLEPEHLGPLVIRLTTSNGRIRAELLTATDGATGVLASGQTHLRDKLARLGFAVADVEVRRRDQRDDQTIRAMFGEDA